MDATASSHKTMLTSGSVTMLETFVALTSCVTKHL